MRYYTKNEDLQLIANIKIKHIYIPLDKIF